MLCNCMTQLILIVNLSLLLMYCFSIQDQFIEACKTGNVGVVQKLLKRGADPNQTDDKVRSFSSAVQYSNICCVPQYGMSAIHWASNNGHDEVVRVLLAAKATVNTQSKVSCIV